MFKNKPNTKYGNKKVEYMGITFDSKRERDRYIVLMDAQAKGIISDLEVQPKYELVPAVVVDEVVHLKTKDKIVQRIAQKAITYKADFKYMKDGEEIIEDVKISEYMLPKEFVLKEKMMFALKGKKIRRVYKPSADV